MPVDVEENARENGGRMAWVEEDIVEKDITEYPTVITVSDNVVGAPTILIMDERLVVEQATAIRVNKKWGILRLRVRR